MADAAYGLWPLVIPNIALFVVFAMSFFQPRTERDWRATQYDGFSSTPHESEADKECASSSRTLR
ncbi:hypothetical protein SAMN04488564_108121 [Lentzea waywayandensis]|uniref:Uncharacterized protein n=1 Tax=Lentzea waywayandensis TaxID=84724 RepID=A0A1I6F4I6_9PSEU|nr:hypothetical protein SAMN04488564_108121 [Lentzea waywayandensis]